VVQRTVKITPPPELKNISVDENDETDETIDDGADLSTEGYSHYGNVSSVGQMIDIVCNIVVGADTRNNLVDINGVSPTTAPIAGPPVDDECKGSVDDKTYVSLDREQSLSPVGEPTSPRPGLFAMMGQIEGTPIADEPSDDEVIWSLAGSAPIKSLVPKAPSSTGSDGGLDFNGLSERIQKRDDGRLARINALFDAYL
jgi:hypothetical protein